MSGLLKARIAFAIAMGLLLACALVVYGTLRSFAASERLVQHTQQVQVLLGETEAAIASGGRARMTYVLTGDEDAYQQYGQALARIPAKLAELRRSTIDEPTQQAECARRTTRMAAQAAYLGIVSRCGDAGWGR